MFVYYLRDPRDNELRYVGITKDPADRYYSHCNEAVKTYKSHWVTSLFSLGLVPVFQIVCIVQDVTEAKRLEIGLIAAFRGKGARLTNLTAGGDGCLDFRHDLPARKKMSLARKGRKFTEQHRRALSVSLQGKKKTITPAVKAAHERLKGQQFTNETRLKITNALIGHGCSEGTRQKMSTWQKGKKRGPLSEETRQKMKLSGIERWAKRKGASS